MYYLSKILEDLIIAKNHHGNSLQLLFEEKVDCYGKHAISILCNEGIPVGIATRLPWYLEQVKNWLPFASQTVSEETKRICVLSNRSYNWLK